MFGDPSKPQMGPDGQPVLGPDGKPMPDLGIMGLHGAAALRAQGTTSQQLDDLIANTRATLGNDKQRLEFDQFSRRYRSYLGGRIGQHVEQQGNVWWDSVQKATADTAIGHAAANADDPTEVANAIHDLRNTYVGQAERLGADGTNPNDPVIKDAINKADRTIYETQVKALLPTNPAKAMQIFDANRELLSTSPNYDALSQRLQSQAEKGQVDEIARNVFAGGVSPGVVTGQSGPRAQNIPTTGLTPQANALIDTIVGPESNGEYDRLYQPPGQPAKRITDLSKFPQWEGAPGPAGISHAAGGLQFEPATWAAAQQATGVPDFSRDSQRTAGWWLASTTYKKETGQDLQTDLAAGKVDQVKDALKSQWPSITDKSIAQLSQSLGAAPASGPAAVPPSQQPPAGFPTLEGLISKIPDGLSDQMYERVRSKISQQYNHLWQATSAERGEVQEQYKGGIAMLSDGRDFTWDEPQIRRLFPQPQADEMVQNLQDAQSFGRQVVAVRGMSPAEIATQQQANDARLAASNGPGYERERRQAEFFDHAAQQHVEQLNKDPSQYVTLTNPEIQRAAQAVQQQDPKSVATIRGNGQPDAVETYAAKMLQEQDRLGVDPLKQHVLPKQASASQAADIMADPEHAQTKIAQLQQTWGNAWPSVYRDLVTDGKLPAAYQALPSITDPGQAGMLARALGEYGKNGKDLQSLLPPKAKTGPTGVDQLIEESQPVKDFMLSMARSAASDGQRADLLNAMKTLGYANIVYGGADPATAAEKAIDAFTGKYDFSLPGKPRVPVGRVRDVGQNADLALRQMDLSQIRLPTRADGSAIFGLPGQPSPDDYLSHVRDAPSWINSPKMDAIWLTDPQGRIVMQPDGNPFAVPFSRGPAPISRYQPGQSGVEAVGDVGAG